MAEFWRGRRVLITGVCGTIGRSLLQRLLDLGAAEVRGLDINETSLFLLSEDFSSESRASFRLGDVRDRDQLSERFRGVDTVIHAAAYKHVYLCESSPRDGIATNVSGTQNVIDAARAAGVERVLFTSSDKAVNPTNVMGTSKLLGERLMTAAALSQGEPDGPIYASTRFGNVLGSSGSVIPVFRRQIQRGGPVTLTDPEMNRFVMTTEEATNLVLESARRARGGEVFVTKMRCIWIRDLAEVMVTELASSCGHEPEAIQIEVTGSKPGEKLYEELMTGEELRRTVDFGDFFVILPAFAQADDSRYDAYRDAAGGHPGQPYNSALDEKMSIDDLAGYVRAGGLLDLA